MTTNLSEAAKQEKARAADAAKASKAAKASAKAAKNALNAEQARIKAEKKEQDKKSKAEKTKIVADKAAGAKTSAPTAGAAKNDKDAKKRARKIRNRIILGVALAVVAVTTLAVLTGGFGLIPVAGVAVLEVTAPVIMGAFTAGVAGVAPGFFIATAAVAGVAIMAAPSALGALKDKIFGTKTASAKVATIAPAKLQEKVVEKTVQKAVAKEQAKAEPAKAKHSWRDRFSSAKKAEPVKTNTKDTAPAVAKVEAERQQAQIDAAAGVKKGLINN